MNLRFWVEDKICTRHFSKQASKLSQVHNMHLNLPSVIFPSPFNSHEWPRYNFSLPYQYNIKQVSDENEEKYQLGDY